LCRCSLALAVDLPRTIPEQIQKINHPRKINSSAINLRALIEKYNAKTYCITLDKPIAWSNIPSMRCTL
jgi:hypothetical protein